MRPTCLAFLLPLFLTLLATSCDSHKRASSADASALPSPADGSPTLQFPAETVAKGCAKVLACASNAVPGIAYGVGHCVTVLTQMGAIDLTQQTSLMSFYDDDYDWLLHLSLMQNMDCVQGAADCSAILACVNQGQAQATCTPPEDYPRWRRCSDGDHMRGCSAGVGATFDCSKLGLGCVENTVVPADKSFAACARPVAGSQPLDTTIQVTCQGDEASFRVGNGEYNFDCNYLGAACVPGNYDLSADGPPYCRGKRSTACDPSTFVVGCDGDLLVTCIGGQEAAADCTSWGATCRLDAGSTQPRCGFPCASIPENCASGTVTYCGPTGMTTLDCGSVGFSTCQTEPGSAPAEAWCAP